MNHDHLTRPLDVLNDWLGYYGYDKNRKASNSEMTLIYYLLREKDLTINEWRNRWVLSGVATDPGAAFKETFSEVMDIYKNARLAEQGTEAPHLLGLVVLCQGTGKWGVGDPSEEHRKWEELTEEERSEVEKNDPEFVTKMKAGQVPVRIVNAITHAGLIAEATMFYPDGNHEVEVIEQWADSESEDMPESKGAVDDALMSTFAFLQLIEQVVHANADFGMKGLLDVAMNMAHDGDASMMAFVLRMIATGIDGGVFSLEDDE